jgi:hypothetical protein
MANSYTQLGFVKQADGENIGSWGDVLNDQLIDLLDDAIGGYVEVSVASGNVTLAFADGTADNNGRHAVIKFTGSPGASRTVTFPNKQKTYYINNGSDDSVVCTAGTGAQTVTIGTGLKDIIYVDGSDEIHSILQDGAVSEKIISSQTAITSGIDNSNDQLLLRDNSASALKKVSIASIFSSVGGLTDLSGDSSPQLGGDLDVNGNDIVSTSNGNITLTPNGTGVVRVDGSNGIDMQSGAISIKNSGAQSYVRFYCESSNAHYAQLQAPAHSAFAGNITLTLPATTDTLVGKTTTDTLTNKRLTSPKLNEDVAITATATEVNILDGVTATTSELNILDGVTSTASELNILDGVTATASELNILDGVTSTASELNILDGVTSTTAELNILDGVTATAAELNIIDGDTSATSTTLVDADRVVTNDAGTMKQVALSDLKTYLSSAGFSTEDPTALAIALG